MDRAVDASQLRELTDKATQAATGSQLSRAEVADGASVIPSRALAAKERRATSAPPSAHRSRAAGNESPPLRLRQRLACFSASATALSCAAPNATGFHLPSTRSAISRSW